MKKLIIYDTAVVTVGALILAGCPDDSGNAASKAALGEVCSANGDCTSAYCGIGSGGSGVCTDGEVGGQCTE